VFIGQGIRTNLYFFDFVASYMVRHNLFIDAQFTYRKTGSEGALFDTNTMWFNLALRWNIVERRYDF
jgi:hypothetical protein